VVRNIGFRGRSAWGGHLLRRAGRDGRSASWLWAGGVVMQTCCELPGPAGIGRVPRLLRSAAPTLSARGQGRTGLGAHPISRDGQSRPLPTPAAGQGLRNPNPTQGDRALRRR